MYEQKQIEEKKKGGKGGKEKKKILSFHTPVNSDEKRHGSRQHAQQRLRQYGDINVAPAERVQQEHQHLLATITFLLNVAHTNFYCDVGTE